MKTIEITFIKLIREMIKKIDNKNEIHKLAKDLTNADDNILSDNFEINRGHDIQIYPAFSTEYFYCFGPNSAFNINSEKDFPKLTSHYTISPIQQTSYIAKKFSRQRSTNENTCLCYISKDQYIMCKDCAIANQITIYSEDYLWAGWEEDYLYPAYHNNDLCWHYWKWRFWANVFECNSECHIKNQVNIKNEPFVFAEEDFPKLISNHHVSPLDRNSNAETICKKHEYENSWDPEHVRKVILSLQNLPQARDI